MTGRAAAQAHSGQLITRLHYYSSCMRQRSGRPRLTARVLLRLNNPIIILITQRPPSLRSPTTILCQISSRHNNCMQSPHSIYIALFLAEYYCAFTESQQCVCRGEYVAMKPYLCFTKYASSGRRRPADCCYYVCTVKHGISADITNTKLHNGHSRSDQEPSPGEGAGSERGTFT